MKRLPIQPGKRRVVPFRRRMVVDVGVIDCVSMLSVVLLNLISNMPGFEFGVQFGFGLRRQVADGRSEIDS